MARLAGVAPDAEWYSAPVVAPWYVEDQEQKEGLPVEVDGVEHVPRVVELVLVDEEVAEVVPPLRPPVERRVEPLLAPWPLLFGQAPPQLFAQLLPRAVAEVV